MSNPYPTEPTQPTGEDKKLDKKLLRQKLGTWRCPTCGHGYNAGENCQNCGRNYLGQPGTRPSHYDREPRPGLRDDVG